MTKINPIAKKIILARLNTLSDDLTVHIGGKKDLSKTAMLNHVIKETDLGKKIVNIQLQFLRDLAKGEIYQDD